MLLMRERTKNKVARNFDALSAAVVQAQHLDGRPQHPGKRWSIMTESLIAQSGGSGHAKATTTNLPSPEVPSIGMLMP